MFEEMQWTPCLLHTTELMEGRGATAVAHRWERPVGVHEPRPPHMRHFDVFRWFDECRSHMA